MDYKWSISKWFLRYALVFQIKIQRTLGPRDSNHTGSQHITKACIASLKEGQMIWVSNNWFLLVTHSSLQNGSLGPAMENDSQTLRICKPPLVLLHTPYPFTMNDVICEQFSLLILVATYFWLLNTSCHAALYRSLPHYSNHHFMEMRFSWRFRSTFAL